MFKKLAPSVLLVVALAFGASACSATNVQRSKFQTEIQAKAKLTPGEASCIAKQVYNGQIPQKSINKLYTSDVATELPPGVESQFETILTNCIKKS